MTDKQMEKTNDEQEEKIEVETQQTSDVDRILKTTITSLFWVLVAGVLLVTCFFSFFPYTSMKFYEDLGIKQRALESAEKYVSRNDSKYGEGNYPVGESKYYDALVYCINTSVYLLDETNEKDYAKKAIKYIERYFELDITSSDRTKIIDDYYRSYEFPESRPLLYSYENLLKCKRADAMLRLGQHKKLFEEMRVESNFISGFNEDKFEKDDMKRASYFFNQLGTYIAFELKSLNCYDKIINENNAPEFVDFPEMRNRFEFFINNNERNILELGKGFTWVYTQLDQTNTDKLRDNIIDLNDDRELSLMLEKLFYVKSLSDFLDDMVTVGIILNVNSKSFPECREDALQVFPTWGEHNKIGKALDGHLEFEPVSSWYNTLLKRYVKDVTRA